MHCKPPYKNFFASENLAELKRGFGQRQKQTDNINKRWMKS